jgi:glycosyltransferase involved in cell wall biosynthesis
MSVKNTLNYFSIGSTDDPSTFSGVNYFFAKALEKNGYTINKVDLLNKRLAYYFDYLISRIINKLFKKSTYNYYRSRLCYFIANRKIKKTCRKFPDAKYNIFTTFSFSSHNISRIPVILFSDDTYEKLIFETFKRNPYFFEKYAIRNERKNIEKVDYVISLFPELNDYIIKKYNRKEKTYFIGNALNFENDFELEPENIINLKLKNRDLLFIGRSNYRQGADLLINAFKFFNDKLEEKFKLHIIGFKKTDFKNIDSNIYFYGYLNKNKTEDFNKYTELIKTSRFFINPTYGGGTYLTTIEVLYLYTPVIIYPHIELIKIFGDNINKAGIILDEESEESLALKIYDAVNDINKWKKMIYNSHEIVKGFSWNNFIKTLEKKLESN